MTERRPKGGDEWFHGLIATLFLNVTRDLIEESHNGPAAVPAEFSSYKIKRLNAVSAFVYLRHARITHKLLHAMLSDVAVATKYLLGQNRIRETIICEDTFDDGR